VQPLVSVVIPAWNVAPFIRDAVDSVLAQQYHDREVLVVNDGSPDSDVLDAVMRWYEGAAGVHYFRQSNGGPSAARNLGIRRAQGDLVAFLDGDDYWDPGYLSAQVARFQEDPALDVVYCDARLFGTGVLAGRTFMEGAPSRGEPTLERLIAMECAVPTTCVVAKRATLLAAGLFDERFRRCEDYDLWLRMSAGGAKFAYQRAVLAGHRVHSSSAAADRVAMFESQMAVYAALRERLGPGHPAAGVANRAYERASADFALARAKRHLAARRYREAADDLGQAHAYYGTPKLALARLAIRSAPALVRRLYVR
jgi:glycosyltransferase involved in cell wall biosynthesis